jgi:conjugative transfer signal peptidase TraF
MVTKSIGSSSAKPCAKRLRIVAIVASVVATAGLAAPLSHPPRLIWNASASAPIGLYQVRPQATFARGELVLIRPPQWVRIFAATRGYLPNSVPMVKRIVAESGDIVCRDEDAISINGRVVAHALSADRAGRALPVWSGCHKIGEGEIFLLMDGVRASFDSRYFGPVPTTAIIGKAVLLWTR